jgi:hypothetical protein
MEGSKMRRLLRFGILGAFLTGTLSACFVRTERVVVAQPAASTCTNAVWIDGHYEQHGRWVPAHWRCTRVVY